MKKISEIKPYLQIIFGALLLLSYLDYLSVGGAYLIIGILALFISVYYIFAGIITAFFFEKVKGNILGTLSLALFPLLLFVGTLITTIDMSGFFGITGWVITIFALIVTLGASAIFFITGFVSESGLEKVKRLFGFLLILVFILNVLFDITGAQVPFGGIRIVLMIIYVIYSYTLIGEIGLGGAKD